MEPISDKTMILGKSIKEWLKVNPLLRDVMETRPVNWINPDLRTTEVSLKGLSIKMEDVMDASKRLERFAPYLAQVFPTLKKTEGIIESPIRPIVKMQQRLDQQMGEALKGSLVLKLDSHLPVSGSIKARGGIYEVLVHGESLALQEGLLHLEQDYRVLDTPEVRRFFGQHRIEVGSTGNLGLSIGIMGAAMGFQVTVHMSQDARQWKKDMLRSKGVEVKEYATDYSLAVAAGRKASESNPVSYFVDDENSTSLFLGYAVAALRLQRQLKAAGIEVNHDHPLFVYLPCGVGGGPGGVAFGLKQVFGDNVHCFFAEPTHSPAVLLGLMTGEMDRVCAQDFGVDNITAADGLAVGRPSGLVCRMMQPLLAGVFTVEDDQMFKLLALLDETENLQLEPSALAGMPGPYRLMQEGSLVQWLNTQGLSHHMNNATHLVWATGGSMVPEKEMSAYIQRGRELL